MKAKSNLLKISCIIAVLAAFNSKAHAELPPVPDSFRNMNNNGGDYTQYLDESDVYYKKGMEYYQANQYSQAIDSFKKALDLAPDRNNARLNLAVAYINKGTYFFNQKQNIEQAASDYRNAIYYLKYDGYKSGSKLADENLFIAQTNLKNSLLMLKITPGLQTAKSLRGQGKFTEAIVEFQYELEKGNNRPEIYEAVGDIYRALQRPKLAVDYYQKALALNTDRPELHLKFAKSLQDAGNNEAAVKEFSVALNTSKDEQKGEILKNLENIWIEKIKKEPRDSSAHMNLGVVLQKKGDLDGALREYKIAETIDPNNITTRLNLGTLFQAKKDYITALRAYDTILQVRPDHVLAHYYKGTALKEMGKFDDAIKEFQAILRQDPNNAMAKEALFETVMLFPDKNDTLNALSTLAENNPKDPIAQYKYAFYLHSVNRPDEAINYYRRTINIDPSYADAYMNIAAIYREKGQPELAAAALKDGLKVMPDNSKIKDMVSLIDSEAATNRYNNALKMHTEGKYAEAIDEYKKIIEISEPDADLYVNLGAAYQAINRNKDAITAYEKAVALDNKNSTALYYLGTAYSQDGQQGKALKSYQSALALDPENENIKQAIASSKQSVNSTVLEKGVNEYNQGKYKEALLTMNTAIINDAKNPDAYYQRAIIYDAMAKYPLAIADYQQVIKYNPDMEIAYYGMALDYDQMKNYPEAKKWYQKFIEKSQGQDNEYIKYSKQRISKL